MKLKISHTTHYSYDAPVTYALQQVRLTPRDDAQQKVLDWNVTVDGGLVELDFVDQHNNHTMLVNVEPGKSDVHITASGEVETSDTSGILGKVHGPAPLWHFKQNTPRTQPGKRINKLARLIGRSDSQLNDLHALSKAILDIAPYGTGGTFAETTAEQALEAQSGVCQDHAQIFIAAARKAGLPARYVSGYLMMNDRIEQEASHAWAEAYLDDLGWVGFDVSNRISPDERYVKLATGLDSYDATPVTGIRMGSATESMIVSVQIQQ